MELVFGVVGLALAGGLSALGVWRQRRRHAEALRRAHDALEQRVGERTAALNTALVGVEAEGRRLAAADRAKSEFLLAMGREMRQPLHAILGFSQLMRRDADADLLGPRQAQAVLQIEKAAAGLLALAEDVADFAAAQGARALLFPQRVDLRLVVRQACDALAAEAQAAGVTLECPPPAAGLGVVADPSRLRQILRRLIADAVRHTARGGVVRVEIRRARGQLAVLVHDTGFDAPEHRLEALFQPFNTVDRAAAPGAGVGLAAAQRWAEAMGGGIVAARRRHAGVTFTLRLPAAGPAPQGALPPIVALYVDDAPTNAALMRYFAAAVGDLTLHVADSSAEGLALAQALQPDVIILDADRPDLDVFEMQARLHADPATRDLPMLILSAAPPGSVDSEAGPGSSAWLAKPLDMEALQAALHDRLGHRQHRSAAA
jgi:signal transduction histidine kinase/CheY-like chemotaxis protein